MRISSSKRIQIFVMELHSDSWNCNAELVFSLRRDNLLYNRVISNVTPFVRCIHLRWFLCVFKIFSSHFRFVEIRNELGTSVILFLNGTLFLSSFISMLFQLKTMSDNHFFFHFPIYDLFHLFRTTNTLLFFFFVHLPHQICSIIPYGFSKNFTTIIFDCFFHKQTESCEVLGLIKCYNNNSRNSIKIGHVFFCHSFSFYLFSYFDAIFLVPLWTT